MTLVSSCQRHCLDVIRTEMSKKCACDLDENGCRVLSVTRFFVHSVLDGIGLSGLLKRVVALRMSLSRSDFTLSIKVPFRRKSVF